MDPVYVRRVDPSDLEFSLSLHRHSYIYVFYLGLPFSINNKQTKLSVHTDSDSDGGFRNQTFVLEVAESVRPIDYSVSDRRVASTPSIYT